jgi:NTP pyrophosphatase (non-canonical NTP hydrolase)
MNFDELQKRALDIRQKYDELNQENRGVVWSPTDLMSGFVGDVGDLSKIIMAKSGLRAMDNIDEKLKHELADCLWSILVLAAKYDIKLDQEFMKVMNELEARIAKGEN